MKKRIRFSTSGGGQSMLFTAYIKALFGSDDLEDIAKRIASTCMNTSIRIEYEVDDDLLTLMGSNARCISIKDNELILKSENVTVTDNTITFK